MERQQLIACLTRLAGVYPKSGQFDTDEGITEWLRAFKDNSYSALNTAITEYIDNDTTKFPPSIAELKNLARKYEPVEVKRLTRERVKEGNFELAYEPAIGYRDNPISNVWVNVEPDPKKPPVYEERRPYPAYPWKFAEFEKIGDGKDSVFIPKTDPVDHSRESAKDFWDMAQLVGKVMENIPAPDIDGYRREKK